MTTILFYLFGALSLTSGLLAVTRKNAVTSAAWLVVMFFCLAANYVLLEAWFVSVVQVLVYAGAIMVLFLFVIMLLDLRTEELERKRGPRMSVLGVMASIVVLFGLAMGINRTAAHEVPVPVRDAATGAVVVGEDGSVATADNKAPFFEQHLLVQPDGSQAPAPLSGDAENIATAMFDKWVLAFELTSILLLGAILGAVILTKRRLA